jgi:hypothetical protein
LPDDESITADIADVNQPLQQIHLCVSRNQDYLLGLLMTAGR